MSEDSLPRRISFLFLSLLIAANLTLLTYIMAAPKNQNMTLAQLVSLPNNLQSLPQHLHLNLGNTVLTDNHHVDATTSSIAHDISELPDKASKGLSKNFDTFSRHIDASAGSFMRYFDTVPAHIARLSASAVNIYTYIRPADYTHLPEITPLTPIKTITISSAPSAPTPRPAQSVAYRPGSVNASVNSSDALSIAEDSYAWGNCTRWAAIRRAEVGDPIPSTWGNAATWADRAAADGYLVDHHPAPGAIMQTADSAGGLGHVAFVESVNAGGSWYISEMNVLGLDVVDHRTMPLSAAADYNFIHDKN